MWFYGNCAMSSCPHQMPTYWSNSETKVPFSHPTRVLILSFFWKWHNQSSASIENMQTMLLSWPLFSLVSKWIHWKLQMQKSQRTRQAGRVLPPNPSRVTGNSESSQLWKAVSSLASHMPQQLQGMRRESNTFYPYDMQAARPHKQNLVPCCYILFLSHVLW